MAIETWYVMEDGSVGDPREIAPDAGGRLRHKDGRAVEYRPHGPRSRGGVDAEAERAKTAGAGKKPAAATAKAEPAADEKDAPPARDREVKAEPGGKPYKTR